MPCVCSSSPSSSSSAVSISSPTPTSPAQQQRARANERPNRLGIIIIVVNGAFWDRTYCWHPNIHTHSDLAERTTRHTLRVLLTYHTHTHNRHRHTQHTRRSHESKQHDRQTTQQFGVKGAPPKHRSRTCCKPRADRNSRQCLAHIRIRSGRTPCAANRRTTGESVFVVLFCRWCESEVFFA